MYKIAIHSLEARKRLNVFDAFGAAQNSECLAEADGCGHDLFRTRGVCRRLDEGFVDLELGQRQFLDEGQGRIPRAEVVKRDGHPKVAQLAQYIDRVRHVAEHGCFGDFYLDLAAAYSGSRCKGGKARREQMARELQGRNVEGNLQIRAGAGVRIQCLPGHAPEEFVDQSKPLDNWNEL